VIYLNTTDFRMYFLDKTGYSWLLNVGRLYLLKNVSCSRHSICHEQLIIVLFQWANMVCHASSSFCIASSFYKPVILYVSSARCVFLGTVNIMEKIGRVPVYSIITDISELRVFKCCNADKLHCVASTSRLCYHLVYRRLTRCCGLYTSCPGDATYRPR
jgi:hypothetical protein